MIIVIIGDTVLVRTGQIRQVGETGSWGDCLAGPAPGLGVSAADFLCGNEGSVRCDRHLGYGGSPERNAVRIPAIAPHPSHQRGMLIGEISDLESLAMACEEERRWEFSWSLGGRGVGGSNMSDYPRRPR